MARGDREKEYPSAMEALENDEAREKRAARGGEVEAQAVEEAGAQNPKEIDQPLPMEIRPGLPPIRPAGRLRVGDEGAPPIVEENQSLLDAVQDPYNERRTKAVPMVNTVDSYGNIVQMPV